MRISGTVSKLDDQGDSAPRQAREYCCQESDESVERHERQVHQMSPLNWHVAEAIFQSSINGARPEYVPLIERSWFLISAPDEEAALSKATEFAKAKRESYANADGEVVDWVFVRIERIREIMDVELKDGTEVWAEIERAAMDETQAM